jgi:hypothetical protein
VATKKKTLKKAKPIPRNDLIDAALDFKRQGATYNEISREMKISVDEAEKLVVEGLAQIRRETVQDRIMLDIDRVNAMMQTLYSNAIGGDSNAISQVTSLMDRRNKLEELVSPVDSEFFQAIKAAHKRMGRMPHKPTPRSRGMVQVLALHGAPHEKIAEYMDLSLKTLLLHYETELTDPKGKLASEAGYKLVDQWRKGNLSALIFYLKTQGGYREEREPYPSKGGEGGGGSEPSESIVIRGGLPDPEPLTGDPQAA